MDQGVSTIEELLDACAVLFGPGVSVSLDFLNYLKPEGIKAAYRKKVLATHPDRAHITGKDVSRMSRDFRRATSAYYKLRSVVDGNRKILPSTIPGSNKKQCKAPRREKPAKEPPVNFDAGNLPRRKLLICQFLYYSGCISWKTHIDALIWQRRRRPIVGRIAQDLGLLSEKEIRAIIRQRVFREKFGESAVRMGFLTPYKLMVILGTQHRFQIPIGNYFVESGIFTKSQMEMLIERQTTYNKTIGS